MQWLLGGDNGKLFQYNSNAHAPVINEYCWGQNEWNISSIDVYENRTLAVGETDDPPPNIKLSIRNAEGIWDYIITDINQYIYGSKLFNDGIVLLTPTMIYRCNIADVKEI